MVDNEFDVEAIVHLGQLTPDDVCVQLFSGQLNTLREIGDDHGESIDMTPAGQKSPGRYVFKAKFVYHTSGERGLSVRVLPHHEFLPHHIQPGLITWAQR
jgi:glycogen phosphorylase